MSYPVKRDEVSILTNQTPQPYIETQEQHSDSYFLDGLNLKLVTEVSLIYQYLDDTYQGL